MFQIQEILGKIYEIEMKIFDTTKQKKELKQIQEYYVKEDQNYQVPTGIYHFNLWIDHMLEIPDEIKVFLTYGDDDLALEFQLEPNEDGEFKITRDSITSFKDSKEFKDKFQIVKTPFPLGLKVEFTINQDTSVFNSLEKNIFFLSLETIKKKEPKDRTNVQKRTPQKRKHEDE